MELNRDAFIWLVPPLSAGLLVYALYLWMNPYPAHSAGFYFTMARELAGNGYALPQMVPYYTSSGVPFAYPPLGIYLIALIRAVTGFGPLLLSRWVPGVFVIASLVPLYFVGRELLGSRLGGALVGVMVAVNPQLIDWHLTAGGLVRGLAFFFTLVGLYAGIHIFRAGPWEWRWLALGIASFVLTVLTSPTYALFFGVSYLVLVVGMDRSRTGFVNGIIVGGSGIVITAPWWITVAQNHGFGVFFGAMGTHGGVTNGVITRLWPIPSDPVVLFLLFVLVGSILLGLVTNRWILVAWLLSVGLVLSQPRFTLFVGTFLVVAIGLDIWSRFDGNRRSRSRWANPALLLVFAVLLSALTGAGYIRDDTAAPRSTVTPNHIDASDLDAMQWARSNTAEDASFVVISDTADWFPLFAERTLLISPWGAEWAGAGTYDRHTRMYRTVSRCDDDACVSTTLDRFDVRPTYVYVPKDRFYIQGTPRSETGKLARSMERSTHYERVFENADVAIFRTIRTQPASTDSPRG